MSYRIDDTEFIDIEPGGYSMPEPDMQAMRTVAAILCMFLVIGFLCEYKQEHASIQFLKMSNSVSASCLATAELDEQPWIMRMISMYSGLDDQHARQCHEQRRIDSLLSWPNPLLVLVNLIWRATIGDNGGMMITHLLSRQSYIVQVSLIVATAVIIGGLLYSFASALPGYLIRLTTRSEQAKQSTYDEAQRQLRGTRTELKRLGPSKSATKRL